MQSSIWDGRVSNVLLELVENWMDYPREFLMLKLMSSMECIDIPIHDLTNQVEFKDGEMAYIDHSMMSISSKVGI